MSTVEPTTYRLHIELLAARRLTIGRLGVFDFPAGRYVYTGSARNGLGARIRRHLGARRKLHWHVDYLLDDAAARVVAVERLAISECAANAAVIGDVIVPGFGASDCHSGCGAHLKYLGPPTVPSDRRSKSD